MTIEVVAVGGIDVRSQPQPWVGELHPCSPHVLRELRERTSIDGYALLECERSGSIQPPAFEPFVEEMVVVVAGDEHHPAVADRGAQLLEEGARDVDRGGQGHVAKLHDVAEQDHLVDVLERRPQPLAKRGPSEQVDRAARGEVDVGEDDGGAHAPILACRVGGAQR